ncbi:hypothetical protein HFD88_000043 [Aspergillus terreus]|nr:hypothetical protein HFD88_000043 [Aspergillus terreus]
MKLNIVSSLVLLQSLACSALNVPFSVSGRWIHDSKGKVFTYAGANWPGAGEVMIPEGMQYASIASTVSKLKNLGMNVIRLTFPTELVDDILDNGGDVTVQKSLTNALGLTNGTKVFDEIRKVNPQITASTTRLQVYDMVAAECNKQGIYVHLDNHISKAMWCCSTTDGNAWFGDTYFDVPKWMRGLEYMVSHAKSWPNFVSIGLRNELRQPATANSEYPYNWGTWYTQMTTAAKRVNAANPSALIFLSGLNYDTTLSPIPTASDLGNGVKFRLSDFAFASKLVMEIHNYETGATSCSALSSALWNAGLKALNSSDPSIVNSMPVVLTEFGFLQDSTKWKNVYASCLRTWIPEQHVGWMTWVIAGSYYIRQGNQDMDETWGMLDHTWSGWRSQNAIQQGLKLRLLVHWQTETYRTFTRGEETKHVWLVLMLEEALGNPFLMHGVLAVSALHISLAESFCLGLASAHKTKALHSFVGGLTDINLTNAKAMVSFAGFVVAFTFGSALTGSAEPDKPSLDALKNIFMLCRSVQKITNTALSHLRQSTFTPLFNARTPDTAIPSRVKKALKDLTKLNEDCSVESTHPTATYLHAIETLMDVSVYTYAQLDSMTLAVGCF